MSGTAQPVASGYEKVLADLISYAHEDWLGMEVVASAVRECFDHRPSYAEVRPLAIRAVSDLINAGASAGDVTAVDSTWRFDPWPVSSEQAIQQITRDLEERDTYPEPGEIGWITFLN
jgi:hypothetical protein